MRLLHFGGLDVVLLGDHEKFLFEALLQIGAFLLLR